MAYDEGLAQRVLRLVERRPGSEAKKMFGGIGFLINGNMCCGVSRSDLIVRMDKNQAEDALKEPHARIFDMTGRPMKGWIVVAPAGLETEEALERWVQKGIAFAESLPAK